MIVTKDIAVFEHFIESEKAKGNSYDLIGSTSEHFSGVTFEDKPANNKFYFCYVLRSLYQEVVLTNTVKITEQSIIQNVVDTMARYDITMYPSVKIVDGFISVN